MGSFPALGISAEVCAALERWGVRAPNAFQAEAIPVWLRGTTTVGVAASGSGKTLAYGVALAERAGAAEPGAGPYALVLRPTDRRAAETAARIRRWATARGHTVRAVRPDVMPAATVLVGSPRSVLDAVHRSALKFDALRILVVDGLSDMLAWDLGSALDTLVAATPADTQRIVFTPVETVDAADWIERHARRARRLGAARGGAAGIGAAAEDAPELAAELYVEPRDVWPDRLGLLLAAARAKGIARAVVVARTESEAAEAADALAVLGAAPGDGPDAAAQVATAADPLPSVADALSVSWGPPFDAGQMRARAEGAARAALLVEPDEATHARAAAEFARVRLRAGPAPLPDEPVRSLAELQARLRQTLAGRDLAPYLLALEPLFAEHPAAEVAAAAAALLRERAGPEPVRGVPAWVRLYVGVGRRDGVRPGDLVGCITGEAGIPGAQVGRIDLRDTFSVVEVSADVAERVVRALSTAKLKGRPLNARPFRG
jgi:ATP-dependent RNA helicase DeaD